MSKIYVPDFKGIWGTDLATFFHDVEISDYVLTAFVDGQPFWKKVFGTVEIPNDIMLLCVPIYDTDLNRDINELIEEYGVECIPFSRFLGEVGFSISPEMNQ